MKNIIFAIFNLIHASLSYSHPDGKDDYTPLILHDSDGPVVGRKVNRSTRKHLMEASKFKPSEDAEAAYKRLTKSLNPRRSHAFTVRFHFGASEFGPHGSTIDFDPVPLHLLTSPGKIVFNSDDTVDLHVPYRTFVALNGLFKEVTPVVTQGKLTFTKIH